MNLGALYAKARNAAGEPSTELLMETSSQDEGEEPRVLHIALVKIRAPQLIDDEAITAIGRTITQLSTLGMQSIVLVDAPLANGAGAQFGGKGVGELQSQMDRVLEALHLGEGEAGERPRARQVNQLFETQSHSLVSGGTSTVTNARQLRIPNPDLLHAPLRRGVVPVISPVGVIYDPQLRNIPINTNEAIVELIRRFQGVVVHPSQAMRKSRQRLSESSRRSFAISFDRIIILDPWGGIPSAERAHEPHVYINLRQEYRDIRAQLKHYPQAFLNAKAKSVHAENLQLMHDTLEMLPESSSGLIVTPEAVALTRRKREEEYGPQVRTRSKRNPLIHNLLTDKPSISSSLPYGRSSGLGFGGPTSTFLKRGLVLTTIPDVFAESWSFSNPTISNRSLYNPTIDLPKLVRLIEASFGKKLDVDRFLARVNDRFAGLVVAGDYEGCALFTWETSPEAPGLRIPYLDKFAVLPQSQGTGASVADILFTCMIMDCFPDGVCWRSRASNPVNKWYFERAKGAWKIPGSPWTTFWTTNQPSKEELLAYEAICRDIPPTWPT